MNLSTLQIGKIYGAMLLSIIVWTVWTLLKYHFEHRGDFFSWTGHKFITPIGKPGDANYWDGLFYFSTYIFYYSLYICVALTCYAAYVASGFRIFSLMGWLWLGAIVDYAIHCNYPFCYVSGFPLVYLHFALVVFLICSIVEIKRHLKDEQLA